MLPAAARASEPHNSSTPARAPHRDISIEWNGELTRANGVRKGRGTVKDPYVISGWTVGNIRIKDTDKAIRIENTSITGQLTLDWVGANVTVHKNEIGDLRVNQNNARWGNPMAGMIMHNTIGTVGQLRHFDGMFSYNRVGSPQDEALKPAYPATRAVNFDGFNGARFAANTIYGYVDARLHGHHHSSGYGATGSHLHGGGPMQDRDQGADHTKRYHEVLIQNNRIFTSHTYALSYLDTGHAGNDRTANSETNPYLNAPHTHFTRANLLGNQLTGAGILVDVFNAKDERHTGTPSGTMNIAGNTVTIERSLTKPFRVIQGIEIHQARYLTLNIKSNTVNGPAPLIALEQLSSAGSQGAGILLNGLDFATVTIEKATITNRQFGIQAIQLTQRVRWTIKGLTTSGVQQDVAYDSTVKNPPKRI